MQSWIKAIRDKPETLVKAVAEAEKVAAYMEYKAELIQQKEYGQMLHASMEMTPEEKPLHKKALEARGPRL